MQGTVLWNCCGEYSFSSERSGCDDNIKTDFSSAGGEDENCEGYSVSKRSICHKTYLTIRYHVKSISFIALKYRYLSPQSLSTMMYLSHLSISLRSCC